MESRIVKITRILLDFMFYTGFLVTAGIIFIIRAYGKYNHYFKEYWIALSVIFILSGILALLILAELRKILKSVQADDCFIRENVISLSKMGDYSFMIVVVTCFRIIIYLTPAVLVIILTFLIAGLFSKVLSQVFDAAVTYKLENDLTI
ncbi:MAG: DUF2975 domain-containing protein [Lachnospiraceae bacterium]|nr:DUF2975 domain-containing protein [Lachnospiraceae bacterium]